jgi:hypothetical protein
LKDYALMDLLSLKILEWILMSAEIAILNKLAVALATDSAVTVSSGDQEHKTYDSADKLFDLSNKNPIGIMIYNGLQFMQAPLQVLIAEYRASCRSFDTVHEAAHDFLRYLNDWGRESPQNVMRNALEALIIPALDQLRARITRKQSDLLTGSWDDDLPKKVFAIPHEVLEVFEATLKHAPTSEFVGGKAPKITAVRNAEIKSIIEEQWPTTDAKLTVRLVKMAKRLINLSVPSVNQTGMVIAGFGNKEKFPSLISFSIDGIIFDTLKFSKTNFVDIDRDGDKARVIPFAQKEMVERFLYGLDSEIERRIALWCKDAIPELSNQIIESLVISPEDKANLLQDARTAEDTFINDLRNKRFEEIRTSSRSAIEGMVEFMPKPELARMAEALVNLTSLKRRVSRGMDTVGGPIDVAVISRTEGFIWVKRKHYFDADLNPRYISRITSPGSHFSPVLSEQDKTGDD